METLVSIIIPVYNRSHLIGETFDSIIKQTYANWECVLVDDGSSDASVEVIKSYRKKDARFKLFMRPETSPKGANACRNIGLRQAQGAYVVFFDSDDLMTPDHLEVKIKTIEAANCDYVIAKTKYFNHPENNDCMEAQYCFESSEISAFNYITHKTVWLTLDVCIKTTLARSLQFNEQLQSGQEYNYFSKLTCKSENAIFIDNTLSLRRYHEQSIRAGLRHDKHAAYLSYFYAYWYTYQDIKDGANKKVRQFLLYRCYRMMRKLPRAERSPLKEVHKVFYRELGGKGLYYTLLLELKHVKG
ncbi:glycosyltransferase family 2 protein [Mangrovimonas sp. TPBH4]|uniref:glycosyltransferase family 2 protein n=1 Tax=Mangrovimonas sp. TPBH4 TaxID=1645914 RepID=UPI0006B4CAD1|nr:glycosyltransferase family 2 protein [Mangrovimonas sp. TPBH4]